MVEHWVTPIYREHKEREAKEMLKEESRSVRKTE